MVPSEAFRRLHTEAITDLAKIDSLLFKWKNAGLTLRRWTNGSIAVEVATISSLEAELAVLDCVDFRPIGEVLSLSTEFEGTPYFFSVQVRRNEELVGQSRRLTISKPGVIYRTERRDRVRKGPSSGSHWVKLVRNDGQRIRAQVVDRSGDGMGIILPIKEEVTHGETMLLEGTSSDASKWAFVRNSRAHESNAGWRHVGLAVRPTRPGSHIRAETATTVLEDLGGLAPCHPDWTLSSLPSVVEFRDQRGESIVGLLDHSSTHQGSPAILIPAAWGKTKETLAGLAATILATFAAANLPISVLRFDGIRKRGESHNDPECHENSLGNLNYTFTQGATDLLAAARFLQLERHSGPIVIVSFSVASIEARRALVLDRDERFKGWVSVVGATDPQSLIRVITGGVDYLGGAEQGIRFGRQNVQGMLLDIDRTSLEAISSKIAFLEDTRRDFANIRCPVTWIAGSNDAWTDPSRIDEVLSFGPSENRRLIRSDTGHQIRSSRKAIEIFGIVASECARMLGDGSLVRPVAPDQRSLRRRLASERRRLKERPKTPNLRTFWRDYLVGRDSDLGMELVSETSAYQTLMRKQIALLGLAEGQSILDLGSGISTFERALQRTSLDLRGIRIIAVDYILEGVLRGRKALSAKSELNIAHIVADIDPNSATDSIPLARNSADRVIGSLVINYLRKPSQFIAEIHSLLRPNGRMVVSALRRDADTSKICVDGVLELRTGRGLSSFGYSDARKIDQSLGGFINEAARLLDLEEQGVFRFWDRHELESLVRASGFVDVETVSEFGNPPQAWVLTATKPA